MVGGLSIRTAIALVAIGVLVGGCGSGGHSTSWQQGYNYAKTHKNLALRWLSQGASGERQFCVLGSMGQSGPDWETGCLYYVHHHNFLLAP